ncbi:MAG TPA: prenyltransferase/squalene oxidase repeat-containing protein [Tepidisphaeraceae bacterium]|nr:prenyltransferase/squalene oxidase repeat-containing protein [Tepidisphaeraceae bacterium]
MFRKAAAVICMFALSSVCLAQNDINQKLQQSIDKGLAFIKSSQQPDGSWQKGQEPPAFTALALRALVLDPKYNADTDFVKKGYDKLLASQVGDGGIYSSELTCYNTAIALSSFAAGDRPQFKEAMDRAMAYLRGFQWNETLTTPKGRKVTSDKDAWYGGWGYEGNNGRPDLSNTQMAIEAMHDAGLKPDDPAYKNAIKFLSRMQNRSESNDQPWSGNDGGFIYSPGEDDKGDSKAGIYTDSDGKRMVRSYGSMTYAGLKSFVYAGLSKDDPRVQAAWDWISKNWTLDENPGMRLGNPQAARQGMFYYMHTLARALNAYDQTTITDPQGKKHDWRVELIDKLVSLQKSDGSWAGEARWMESNPILATSYCVLALEEVRDDLKEHPAP